MSSLLQDHSLESIAQYLNSDVCDQRVFVLASRQARVFPTSDLPLQANLAKLNLPYAEAVFAIDYFLDNPQPFYTLARDIAPGRFIPTPTHIFIRLLHQHGKLHTCFTQNIDTLERKAGVPSDKVVEAHGSFASSRCIRCKTPYDNDKMAEHIAQARVPTCPELECDGLVKPDIVFFGESINISPPSTLFIAYAVRLVDRPDNIQLPPEFITAVPALRSAALVIVMGTSLKVQPFAMLPNLVPRTGCPRLLLNLDPAGTIGIRIVRPSPSRRVARAGRDEVGAESDSDAEEAGEEDEWEEEEEEAWVDDVVHLGDCDASVRKLCDLLGWREELERTWKEVGGGESSVSAGPEPEQEGTATTTAGDSGVIGKPFGSIELKDGVGGEENAKQSLGTPAGAGAAKAISPHEEEEEGRQGGVAGVQHVKDNSIKKTMDRIVRDLKVALNISPSTSTKPNPQDGNLTHAPLGSLGKSGLASRDADA